MGVVYLATDLTLGREVALKILPDSVASNPERIQRFRREAQSLASLAHPHVVTIHSVEEENGLHFITMEHVRGKVLSDLIPPGGFDVSRFLRIAIPLADGLAAAHQAGITHRDLKPSNVMVSDDGHVKIIDLGLAKLVEVAPTEDTQLPTEALTAEGHLVGTPPYASPEQLEGRAIDHRSDIFSLGTLYYEMLTGTRPFQGGNTLSLATAILRDQPPPVSESKIDAPPELDRIVRRCLEKEPSERFHDASDIRNALRDARDDYTSSTHGSTRPPVSSQPTPPGGRGWAPIAAAIVVAAGLIALLVTQPWSGDEREAGGSSPDPPGQNGSQPTALPAGAFRFIPSERWSYEPALEWWPAWSPDGTKIAYSMEVGSHHQIFVRDLAKQTEAVQITDVPKDNIQPAWSPDGQVVAFVRANEFADGEDPTESSRGKIRPSDVYGGFYSTEGDVWIYNFADGKERLVVTKAFHPAFNRDGVLALDRHVDGTNRIYTCDRFGNQLRPVTDDEESTYHFEPSWSPDGSSIVFRRQRAKSAPEIAVVDIQSQVRIPRSVTETLWFSRPHWSPDGHFVYVSAYFGSAFNVWRLPVDATGEPLGEFQQVSFGPGPDISPTLSPDGKNLLYTNLRWNSDLWILPMDDSSNERSGDPYELVASTGEDSRGSFSADETKIAFTSNREGTMSIYVAPFDSGNGTAGAATRVTDGGPGGDFQPNWSPNGNDIVFFSRRAGHEDIWRVSVDEAGEPRGEPARLTQATSQDFNPFYSPDGKLIAFQSTRGGGNELWLMNADGSLQTQLTQYGASGHFTPWWDEESIAVPMRDFSDLLEGRERGLFRVFADGRTPELIGAHGGGHVSMSPDREWISENNHVRIVRGAARAKEADYETLWEPDDPDVAVDYSVWSPSGKWILFDRSVPKGGDIFLMRLRED